MEDKRMIIEKKDKKKLLFITTRLFWPTDSGRKVGLYYYCQGLHEQYGYDVYLYSFLENGQTLELIKQKPSFIKNVKIAESIGKIIKLKNIVLKTLLKYDWPIQCSLFYSKKNENQIKEFCKELNPDIVIVDMVRLAPYYKALRNFKCKRILDMDDLLSERYKRQLDSNYKSSIAGQYSSNLSSSFLKLIELKSIKKLILRIEKNLMYKAELNYAAIYDKVIFVSNKESEKLNKIFPEKSIDIPLGVNVDEFINCKLKVHKENNICFVGNMYVAANIDTLKYISTEVLPYVKSEYTLYVIGKVSDEIKNDYANNKNLVFTGRVDNIYDVAKKCKLFLAPIIYGSGIKTKILEAMAMQLPVITNDIGAEGLAVENEKHLIIENNNRKIANLVDYYLQNDSAALEMAVNGQKLVFEKYDWKRIWNKFEWILL